MLVTTLPMNWEPRQLLGSPHETCTLLHTKNFGVQQFVVHIATAAFINHDVPYHSILNASSALITSSLARQIEPESRVLQLGSMLRNMHGRFVFWKHLENRLAFCRRTLCTCTAANLPRVFSCPNDSFTSAAAGENS